MIKPKAEDIERFRNFDVEQFENWLRVALEGLFLDGLGVRYFEPLDYCVLREHTLSADLKIIYRAFGAPQKKMIRAAIARLLERLPAEQRYAPILGELLDFATVIGAREIFQVLPARAETFLSLERESPDAPPLYARAIESLVELADTSGEARRCLERLVGTPNAFIFEHAPDILVAFCRIAPDDFVQHMGLLSASLSRNFKKYRPTKNALRYLSYDIVKAVGLPKVVEAWRSLNFVDSPRQDSSNENWFRDAILPALMIEGGDHGTARVTIKDYPDASATVHTDPRPVDAARPVDVAEKADIIELLNKETYPELLDDRISDQEKGATLNQLTELVGTQNGVVAPT